MELYQEIIEKTKEVDRRFISMTLSQVDETKINFTVPRFHPRSKEIGSYNLFPLKIEDLLNNEVYNLTKKHIFIVAEAIYRLDFVQNFLKENDIEPIVLESAEDKVKTKPFMDDLINKNGLSKYCKSTLVVMGGGLICNVGSYLAERISCNLILFPSTVLSMADSSGGKVRVNLVLENRAYKHFYKSFYEPNAMFIEDRFLDSLPKKQIKIGLVEIIKHGVFQSSKLYEFLFNEGKDILENKEKLKKAILWAEDLKRVCMEVDVEENENGSRRILRGGHDFSDRIEEDEKLKIPHGIAVSIGIINQLEQEGNKELLEKAKEIFDKFNIPYKLGQYKNF